MSPLGRTPGWGRTEDAIPNHGFAWIAAPLSCLVGLLAVFAGETPAVAASQATSLTVPIADTVPATWENPPLTRYLAIQSTLASDATALATPSAVSLAFTILTPIIGQLTEATYTAAPPVRLVLGSYPTGPIHVTAPVIGGAGQLLALRLVVSLAFDHTTGSLTAGEARFTPLTP